MTWRFPPQNPPGDQHMVRHSANAPALGRRAGRVRLIAPMLLILAASCVTDTPLTSPERLSPRKPLADATTLTPTPILWSQPTYIGGHGHASGEFEHADDFIVPTGTQWAVSQLMLGGDQPYTFVNQQQVWIPITIDIRANNAGHPGTTIQSYSLTPIDTESTACQNSFCVFKYNLYQ